jgi:hypothetical protein
MGQRQTAVCLREETFRGRSRAPPRRTNTGHLRGLAHSALPPTTRRPLCADEQVTSAGAKDGPPVGEDQAYVQVSGRVSLPL